MKHTHRLRRHRHKTGTTVYFCTLPDCSYKVAPEFTLGKKSICNLCGEEFILNEYSIRLAKPHCSRCSKKKVTEPDGRKHYVRFDSVNITELAEDKESINSLKNRLSATTEDIVDEI